MAVDRFAKRIDGASAPAIIRRDTEGALADDGIVNADWFARLDRAHVADIRLNAHHFAEMDAGRAAMGNKLAKPHMPGQAGNGIVPGGDGANVAARRHRKFRIGIMSGKAGQLGELR